MPIPGPDPGPFLGALSWIDQLGQVPLNVLRGRPGAAARKAVDTLGDIPDALLPGDWIPHISEDEDQVSASDLVGIDRQEHPGLAKAADLVGGTLVNPLTYLGLRGGAIKAGLPLTEGTAIPGSQAALAAARGLGDRLAAKLPETIRNGASATAQAVRRTANWLDVPDEGQALLHGAAGRGNQAARAATERTKQIYGGLTSAERMAVGELAHGIARPDPADRSTWYTISDPQAYLSGRADIRPDVVTKAASERQGLMDTLAKEGSADGVMNVNPGFLPENYIQRKFGGDYFDDQSPLAFKAPATVPSAIKERSESLKTPDQLLSFLKDQPTANLEFDGLKADMGRSAQQGRMVEKAQLGKGLTGNAQFTLSDPAHRAAVTDAIGQIAKTNPDYAYRLQNVWQGQAPRGDDWFSKGLNSANKLFKSAATFGVVMPRIGFNVRNRIGGLWQALSNDEARGTIGASAKRALSDMTGAFDDGFVKLTGSRRLPASELTGALDHIESAFQQSGGSTAKVRAMLGQHPDGKLLQEALDNGVLDNFVSSERLIDEMAKTPRAQRVNDIMQWPASIAQGLEQRMRLGTFLDLRKGGHAPDGASAAKTIRDTYLDYNVPGVANRRFRDVVPFGAFASQNIKQQAGLLARHPVAGVAAAQLFGDQGGLPKYPWMDQQIAVPTGTDEKGDPQYLTSFGLPLEGLAQVPGTDSSDIYRDVVGQLQPALKTAISYVANKDPLTGNAFGSYDQILGHHAGELGRDYNVAKSTGLLQPFTGPIDLASNFTDPKKSLAEGALQATTGARFVSVDPEQANRQRLEAYLQTRPDVHQSTSFYTPEDDPEMDAVIKQLAQTKRNLAQQRKLAAGL